MIYNRGGRGGGGGRGKGEEGIELYKANVQPDDDGAGIKSESPGPSHIGSKRGKAKAQFMGAVKRIIGKVL